MTEVQQPIALNGATNKSSTPNKKTIVYTKKPTQTATSNKQLTPASAVVKGSEQQKVVVEKPVQTAAATSSNGNKYSEIVNEEFVQAAPSFKKQEKKKAISPTVSTETPKQSPITADDTQQVPFTSIITDSKHSEVSLEKQEPPITVMEEPSVSAISNGESKKSTIKNKKSKRSNAKKGKPKISPMKAESSQQPALNDEEEQEEEEEKIEPSSPSLNLTTIVLTVQNSPTTSKTPSTDQNSINP
jgi:hypothetical protein